MPERIRSNELSFGFIQIVYELAFEHIHEQYLNRILFMQGIAAKLIELPIRRNDSGVCYA